MPAVSLICPHCEKPVEVQVAGVTRTRPCPSCGEMLVLQTTEKSTKARRRALLMGGVVPEVTTESKLSIPHQVKKAPPATSAPATPASPAAPPSQPAPEASAEKPTTATTTPSAAAEAPTEESSPPTPTDPLRSLNFTPSHEPQVLAGDAFDRMRLDPEIKEFRQRLILGASLVLIAIIIAVLLAKYTHNRAKQSAPQLSPAEAAAVLATKAEPPPPPVPEGSLVFRPPGQKEDIQTALAEKPITSADSNMEANLSVLALKQFLSSTKWQDRATWSRPVEGLQKQMEAYYTDQADGAIPVESIIQAREAEEGFYHHAVVFEGGASRPAYVEQTPKGPRVDWASFVGLCEKPWHTIQTEKPTYPILVRVMVADAFYYEGFFGNPGLLKCVELIPVGPPGTTSIHGYCERQGEIAQKIEFWQRQRNKKPFPLTLRIKYPSSSTSPRQVWVTEIVKEGWLIP